MEGLRFLRVSCVVAAMGVDPDVAFGYTIVLHAALWFPITAVGAFYMWRHGVKWREFAEAERARGERRLRHNCCPRRSV